jgi:hypothetical protein
MLRQLDAFMLRQLGDLSPGPVRTPLPPKNPDGAFQFSDHARSSLSSIPRQFPPAPTCLFVIGIKHALNVAVQRPHNADARHHRRAAKRSDWDQGFHGGLPFLGFVLGLRKPCDVCADVLAGDDLATAGQRYGIVKASLPPPIANSASPFCPIERSRGGQAIELSQRDGAKPERQAS